MNAPIKHDRFITGQGSCETLEVHLLDGAGAEQESRECALEILLDLQHYYRRRNLSHEERFGKPCPVATRVLSQLSIAYDRARRWNPDTGADNLVLTLEHDPRPAPAAA